MGAELAEQPRLEDVLADAEHEQAELHEER